MRAERSHALGVELEREAAAVGVFVVLGDDERRARRQGHAAGVGDAVADVLLVEARFRGREVLLAVAHAVGQFELADVVHQRAHAQVEHVGLGQAERAPHQQRDDRDVQRVCRGLVAGRFGQQADAQVLGAEHLVDQRPGQRGGVLGGLLRLARHQVGRELAFARSLGELTLAQLQCGALASELLAVFGALGSLGRQRDRRRSVIAGGGGRRRGHVGGRGLALFGVPAHLLEAERADRGDLLVRRNAELAQRERMRHPAEVQVNEHAHAQRGDVDLFQGGGGSHGSSVPEQARWGLHPVSASAGPT